MKLLLFPVACAFVFTFSLSKPADAASFNCSAAKSEFRKIICADPKLSTLDEQVDKAYRDALAAIPEHGKNDLNTGHYEWMEYVRKMCVPSPGKDRPAAKQGCLDTYQAQLDSLKSPEIVTVGTLTFRRFYRYATIPTDWSERRFGTVTVSYLQIINPTDVGQRVFNKYLFTLQNDFYYKQIQSRSEDDSYEQQIDHVNAGEISFYVETWMYGHGAPHGYAGINFYTWNRAGVRPLSFHDVFKRDVEAEYHLKDIVGGRVDDAFSGDDPEVSAANRKKWLLSEKGQEAEAEAHDTSNWAIFDDGLLLTYQHGGILSESKGYYPCYFLSWDDLKGLVDLKSIERLTAAPTAYGPKAFTSSSSCRANARPE